MGNWTLDVEDRVATLTFARPPRNWMDLASMTELADRLEALASRTDDVTVVMLTGGVDGYFIAHADLDDLALFAKGERRAGRPAAWTRAAVGAGVDAPAHGRRRRRAGVGRRLRDGAGLQHAASARSGRTWASRRCRWGSSPAPAGRSACPGSSARRSASELVTQRADHRRRGGAAHRAPQRRPAHRGLRRGGPGLVRSHRPLVAAGGLRRQAGRRRGPGRRRWPTAWRSRPASSPSSTPAPTPGQRNAAVDRPT